ncbi:hypothetical protein L1987_53369 [Smallanthus sonchifolius]|uniref:Uncharacterized protein n=1 Tax=Smallanthus sonchifolius TaxID=185202 RepID=A0ACB9EWX1_9ASTR|nr:hypothetical protein L1987_53369 [Smallanthus sonchifolius]
MADRSILLFLILFCFLFRNPCYSETDTLQQGQELKDWDELISSNKVFSLKLFSFNTIVSPYLGIFYNYNDNYNNKIRRRYPYNKAVWVANRNNPITDIYGKLIIDVHGKFSILSSGGTVVDLYTPAPLIACNVSAKLLDTGNLVLRELHPDGSVKRVLWESFDYPTDTLLPGMKLGINHKTGHRWSLTSWVNDKLPVPGSFELTGDPNGTSQLVIIKGGNVHQMSGPWRNGEFLNTNKMSFGSDVRLYYVSNETEQSFTYLTKSYDAFPDLLMSESGDLEGSTLSSGIFCALSSSPVHAETKFEMLKCREDYIFYMGKDFHFQTISYIYREEFEYHNLTLYDCKRLCWNNCSCASYSYATKNRTGCKTYGKMLYTINPVETDLQIEYYTFHDRGKKKKKWFWLIIGVGSLATVLSCYFIYKKLHLRGKAKKIQKLLSHRLKRLYKSEETHRNTNNELHYFTFRSISFATNNFSSTNKLGEGGFGAVYKGKLVDGQEIAVKRLSRGSGQGDTEFMNETKLIAKLQHVNLVRLLRCCIEKQEKILVYEYMPNNSLDSLLFDPKKKGILGWKDRIVIIDGIAQGLVYLHKFSRLRVIHRDLKASNVLLDGFMNPKISDFGMAKLSGINENEANTSRVVGTRGYMPPEYMIGGRVSTKTDVFSFGVLMLEIVSSKMNHGSYDVEHPLNLPGLAWELWNQGRGLEFMDPILKDSCSHTEVMTCIHVGLLCVQHHATDRPTMSEAISMLTNENMHLPEPKQPAFFIERHEAEAAREDNLGNGSVNGQSFSVLVAR